MDGALQPTYFDYEKFELKNSRRYWWLYGFEPNGTFLRFHRLKLIKVTDWFRIRAGDESTIHEYNDIRTVI